LLAALWLIIAVPFWAIALHRQHENQELLAELKVLRPGVTSYSEIVALADRYGYQRASDRPCTAQQCSLWKEDFSYPLWALRHHKFVRSIWRVTAVPPWRIYSALTIRDGRLAGYSFSALRFYEFLAEGATLNDAESLVSEPHYAPPPRPGIYEVRLGSHRGDVIGVRISKDASPTERDHAYAIRLSCLNRPRGCSPCEMMRPAWEDYVAYYKQHPSVLGSPVDDSCPPKRPPFAQ
jgi:hypothetical protein